MIINLKNLLKSKLFIFGIVVVLLLSTIFMMYQQVSTLNLRLSESINNVEAYEGIVSQRNAENNALKLSISEIKVSNDRLIKKADSIATALKVAKNKQIVTTVTTQIIKTEVRDTITIVDNEFDKELILNDQTKLQISVANDTIVAKLDLTNEQYLYVYSKRMYANKKNFFKRLFTLDFKRISVTEYKIINTNELIQVGDTRVIEHIDK